MNAIQQGVVALLKSAVTEEKLVLPEGFDIEAAYPLIIAHKMTALIHDGAVRCGIPQQHPVMQKLFQSYCKALQVSARQMRALERVCAAFDAKGIDYMLLKGSIMKALYPKPELRMMGDADVLIRVEQYDRIAPIMEALGFRMTEESDYDFTWDSASLHLELHKSLVPPEQKDFYDYFGSGWHLAKEKKGNRYAMTAEDTFIYMFTHFAKHFRGAGIGCRHMVDLWVYLRKNPAMDKSYVKAELDKLHLGVFYQNMRRTLTMWFEDGPTDDRTQMITEVIFASGNWGTSKARALSNGVQDLKHSRRFVSGKMGYVLRHVFPDFQTMRLRYPVLKKAPLLLPAVWVYHLVKKLFCHKTPLRQHVNNLQSLTKENVENRQQMLSFVGFE